MGIMADRVNRLCGDQVLVFRCDTDGGLLTNCQGSLVRHQGHKVKAPVILKYHELLGVWLGLIK